MQWRGLILALTILLAPSARAEGFDYQQMARELGISEVRAGFYFHDVELRYGFPFALDYSTLDFSKWQNLNLEVLFDLPDIARWIGGPRIGLETSLNFVGQDSYVRLASVWHVPVFNTGIFLEPMAGTMMHNGYLDDAPDGRRELGCRFLYFYGGNIGYNVSDTMTAMVSMEHGSHWAQCEPTANDGINRLGLRLGWKMN